MLRVTTRLWACHRGPGHAAVFPPVRLRVRPATRSSARGRSTPPSPRPSPSSSSPAPAPPTCFLTPSSLLLPRLPSLLSSPRSPCWVVAWAAANVPTSRPRCTTSPGTASAAPPRPSPSSPYAHAQPPSHPCAGSEPHPRHPSSGPPEPPASAGPSRTCAGHPSPQAAYTGSADAPSHHDGPCSLIRGQETDARGDPLRLRNRPHGHSIMKRSDNFLGVGGLLSAL